MPISFDNLTALPLAATEVADEAIFEWTRLEGLSRSTGWAVALGLVLWLAIVWLVYRREARTIPLGKAMLLATLRTVAIGALALFFLGLEKRSSHEERVPSRVVVLADTSLSMNLPSAIGPGATSSSRASEMVGMLTTQPLLQELARSHEVDLVAFGETTRPVAHLRERQEGTPELEEASAATPAFDPASVATKLTPADRETHWGDALAETLERFRGLPLSSIIVLSDGGQNMGLDPRVVIEAAQTSDVKIHTVGFGPLTAPANIALRELIAPERAFPGDVATIQGLVQLQGLEPRELEAQLLRRPVTDDETPWQLVDTQVVKSAAGDELTTIQFDTVPEEPGQFEYELRISPLREEAMQDDNVQRVEMTIVERKTAVLLFAGGPSRDYQFLRNQLRRDKSFTVDVLLQTATEGISQDANKILTEFPATAEAMATYDAVVAFDPDWSRLSVEQVHILDQWVSRGAGGMVVVPGNIYTPRWGNDPVMRIIRGLYPLRFADRLSVVSSNSRPREEPLPLELSREGTEAKFMWLAESLAASRKEWSEFAGVYGPASHMGPKAGATILATLVDERASGEPGEAYLAEHFYGAGQVLSIGSAETWRLREVNPDHFDRLWTQVLRHVSQGRLLQGSPRGKLLVSQDRYEVGATVAVRAIVSDLQFQPATLPTLPLVVERPDGGRDTIPLQLDDERAGNYAAEVRVVLPGSYRLLLTLPDSEDVIERKLRVAVPELEIRNAVREEELMRDVAKGTAGYYYPTVEAALRGTGELPSLVDASPSRARNYRVRGQVDHEFATRQSAILLGVIVGALGLEWLIRRLSYLA